MGWVAGIMMMKLNIKNPLTDVKNSIDYCIVRGDNINHRINLRYCPNGYPILTFKSAPMNTYSGATTLWLE